jgi:hypothetical protein
MVEVKTQEHFHPDFIKKAKGGDVIAQAVQNMMEAVNCTSASITRALLAKPDVPPAGSALDQLVDPGRKPPTEEGGALDFINNGEPGALTIEEFDRRYITLGAPAEASQGKSDASNYHKGHTSYYQALYWECWTGPIYCIARSPIDVRIRDGQPFFKGTRLLLHMPVGHESLARSDADIKRYLSRFVTSKKIYFNGELVKTTQLDLSTFKEMPEGGVKAKFGMNYHGFQLSSGDIAPAEFKNVADLNCAVVVTNIARCDTERSQLEYWPLHYVSQFTTKAEREAAQGENGAVSNLKIGRASCRERV